MYMYMYMLYMYMYVHVRHLDDVGGGAACPPKRVGLAHQSTIGRACECARRGVKGWV